MLKTPLFARSEGYHVPYKAQRGGFCFLLHHRDAVVVDLAVEQALNLGRIA